MSSICPSWCTNCFVVAGTMCPEGSSAAYIYCNPTCTPPPGQSYYTACCQACCQPIPRATTTATTSPSAPSVGPNACLYISQMGISPTNSFTWTESQGFNGTLKIVVCNSGSDAGEGTITISPSWITTQASASTGAISPSNCVTIDVPISIPPLQFPNVPPTQNPAPTNLPPGCQVSCSTTLSCLNLCTGTCPITITATISGNNAGEQGCNPYGFPSGNGGQATIQLISYIQACQQPAPVFSSSPIYFGSSTTSPTTSSTTSPTASPTVSPTTPTYSPTVSPITSPTVPTVSPTTSPTTSPTVTTMPTLVVAPPPAPPTRVSTTAIIIAGLGVGVVLGFLVPYVLERKKRR